MNLSEFYSYIFIGKLTVFLQIQEFCQRNQIVDSSITVAWLFLLCPNLGLEIFSPRLQIYVLIFIYMGHLSHRSLTLTPHTRNFSSINLVFVFRCSSSTTNPVSERRVDSSFLVFSLSSHRYSYITLTLSTFLRVRDLFGELFIINRENES